MCKFICRGEGQRGGRELPVSFPLSLADSSGKVGGTQDKKLRPPADVPLELPSAGLELEAELRGPGGAVPLLPGEPAPRAPRHHPEEP